MRFLDRGEELRRLTRVAAGPESALVVVWGRRRVGKTRVLLEWVRAGEGLYWVADASAASIQRRNLAETLAVRLPGFGEVEYRDWSSLLSRLAREAQQRAWRGPLVLDELPYLIGASPELPASLQRFLDHEAKEARLLVALAGSSQRMMQGLTLSPSAPLFGRARELIKLSPIPAGYLGEALGLRDPIVCLEAHALWGGIPRYWELAASFDSNLQAVDGLALDPLGPLHNEPAHLLLEESPPAVALRPILDAIGGGAHRVSEIAGRIGQPATALARPLARLQELDLVTRETPFGEPGRSSKRSLYKLADPFLRLWFSLIGPRRSILMQVPRKTRLQIFEQAFPRLCALAWEELCRQAVPHLGVQLGGIDYGPANRYWSGGGPEWDLVAEAADRRALLLGEVKWIGAGASATELERVVAALLAKGTPPVRRPEAVVHHAVFVPRLPRRRPRRLPPGVHLIDAAAVLSVLR